MKKVKIIFSDGTPIDFEVEETKIIQEAIKKEGNKVIIIYNNKTILINIENVSFIEIEN